jgi:hypothetical protein
MKQLLLLCSTLHVEAFAQYIATSFEQDTGLPGLSIVWRGKTARHEIGLILIAGQQIPERLLDMIAVARDLFDYTQVFETSDFPAPKENVNRTTGLHDL